MARINKQLQREIALIIENDITPYFFTEKITNCFISQTIPVYLGATQIHKFFNTDGIITISLGASFLLGKMMKPYQIKRLIIFINPDIDPLGAGWNIRNAKIAIGSGSFLGQGFLQGTQSHYRYLPEQHTDFIFCILSEEWGFIGGIFVFMCYTIIFIRSFLIIRRTKDIFGSYIACGVISMLAYHFFVNIGMVLGIMPITGIPLFFLSYGGSSLMTAMIGIGLLQSVNLRRLEFR